MREKTGRRGKSGGSVRELSRLGASRSESLGHTEAESAGAGCGKSRVARVAGLGHTSLRAWFPLPRAPLVPLKTRTLSRAPHLGSCSVFRNDAPILTWWKCAVY